MNSPVLWIHEDCLNPQAPIFRQHPGAPAIFVFDEAYLRREQVSLKRILFLYESLLELPVEIRRGDIVEQVGAFARQHGGAPIVAMATPDPRLRRYAADLAAQLIEPPPFVRLQGRVDLRRFSRYWQKAEAAALHPSDVY